MTFEDRSLQTEAPTNPPAAVADINDTSGGFDYDADLAGAISANQDFEHAFKGTTPEAGDGDDEGDDEDLDQDDPEADPSAEDEADDTTPEALQRGEGDQTGQQPTGPRENARIRELNARALAAERQLAEVQEAEKFGLTVTAYRAEQAEATANNFTDVGSYRQAVAEARRIDAEMQRTQTAAQEAADRINTDFNLSPESRQAQLNLIEQMRRQGIENLQQSKRQAITSIQVMGAQQQQQKMTVSSIIKEGERVLGAFDPELRQVLQDSDAATVQRTVDALTRTFNTAVRNDRTRYAAQLKGRQQRIPPEGSAGGAPPPPMRPTPKEPQIQLPANRQSGSWLQAAKTEATRLMNRGRR